MFIKLFPDTDPDTTCQVTRQYVMTTGRRGGLVYDRHLGVVSSRHVVEEGVVYEKWFIR